MLLSANLRPTPGKHAVYSIASVFLGVLLSILAHAAIEATYLSWAQGSRHIIWYTSFGKGSCALHPALQYGLLIVGAVGGFFLGKMWWRMVYIEQRWSKGMFDKKRGEKIWVSNRHHQKLSVVVEQHPSAKGLVFIMHGMGGFKEQKSIRAYAEAFFEGGCTVVTFDTANTIGESEGTIEKASIVNYYSDLEDIILWAKKQRWYQTPFILVGHSLGGICVTVYAQKHPEEVRALAPTATVISGRLSKARHSQEKLDQWKKDGFRKVASNSKPGVISKIPWSSIVDLQAYDVLPDAHKLTMPVLGIVGDQDTSTPLAHQQMLINKVSGPKELHVIKGAKHGFYEPHELAQVKKIISQWVKKIPQ
jgi:alpha-beta hydrolase superfamily lysophospholipase